MPSLRTVACALLALTAAGCDWPKDPGRTLERVQGGVMHVGVTENPPFIHLTGGEPVGLEADMVRAIAADVHARVQWVPGAESVILKSLKDRRLDLAAVGATAKDPWARELGATKPYGVHGSDKHLLLAPPGENAWILRIDRFTHAHKNELQAKLGAAEAAL